MKAYQSNPKYNPKAIALTTALLAGTSACSTIQPYIDSLTKPKFEVVKPEELAGYKKPVDKIVVPIQPKSETLEDACETAKTAREGTSAEAKSLITCLGKDKLGTPFKVVEFTGRDENNKPYKMKLAYDQSTEGYGTSFTSKGMVTLCAYDKEGQVIDVKVKPVKEEKNIPRPNWYSTRKSPFQKQIELMQKTTERLGRERVCPDLIKTALYAARQNLNKTAGRAKRR